jgi:uncharacterized protein (UPF0335 family)
MGRPRKHATADGEALRNSVDGDELKAYIERIENVNAEIADLNSDRREIFKEVKAAGYDAATVRAIIKRRAMDADKRHAMDDLMDQYMSALGDFASTPLGEAGARENARRSASVNARAAAAPHARRRP